MGRKQMDDPPVVWTYTTPSLPCAPNGTPLSWVPHTRARPRREELEKRFKHVKDPAKPDDPIIPLDIVIVRDMWLTGFDVPPLHTMYIDKPMQGHGLMQTIARV